VLDARKRETFHEFLRKLENNGMETARDVCRVCRLRVLRRMFGPKKKEMAGGLRRTA